MKIYLEDTAITIECKLGNAVCIPSQDISKLKNSQMMITCRGSECKCRERIAGFKLAEIISEMIKNNQKEREIA